MSLADELHETRRARLLALLKQLSYEQREVTLASGAKSNFYIDCKQTVLTAEGHFLVGSLFGHVLATRAPEVEAIGGVSVGADPLASAV
jgi:orotate phosphoribosyltransferase